MIGTSFRILSSCDFSGLMNAPFVCPCDDTFKVLCKEAAGAPAALARDAELCSGKVRPYRCARGSNDSFAGSYC